MLFRNGKITSRLLVVSLAAAALATVAEARQPSPQQCAYWQRCKAVCAPAIGRRKATGCASGAASCRTSWRVALASGADSVQQSATDS